MKRGSNGSSLRRLSKSTLVQQIRDLTNYSGELIKQRDGMLMALYEANPTHALFTPAVKQRFKLGEFADIVVKNDDGTERRVSVSPLPEGAEAIPAESAEDYEDALDDRAALGEDTGDQGDEDASTNSKTYADIMGDSSTECEEDKH